MAWRLCAIFRSAARAASRDGWLLYSLRVHLKLEDQPDGEFGHSELTETDMRRRTLIRLAKARTGWVLPWSVSYANASSGWHGRDGIMLSDST
jgi:hypothetical protein